MIAGGGTPILKVFTVRKNTAITHTLPAVMSAIPAVIYASVRARVMTNKQLIELDDYLYQREFWERQIDERGRE